MKTTSLLITLLLLSAANLVYSQNKTIPGALTSPYPTLINLAVNWEIKGDDNMNGAVSVRYREEGTREWHTGMPLFRVPAGKNLGFSWTNKHAGSIFDLNPDTGYEIVLTLSDPDGGSEERTIKAHTRAVPKAGSSADIVYIKPGVYDTLRTKSGTKQKPVVYMPEGGKATFAHIDMKNRKWVYIIGLNIVNNYNEGVGILMDGASDCMISGCIIKSVYGMVADKPGAFNCYICDNVLTGICTWVNKSMGAHGDNIGEGIELTGSGNVICYNKVTGFRDCISTMEDQRTAEQTCIDIYNNDIYSGVDDAIEADFCFSNCRIFRNRITNCFVGLSSQPGLGGPNYFYRNSMYNLTHGAFKFKRYSQGDVAMHNTVVKVGTGLGGNDSMDYAWFRNNLAIGGPTGGVKWGDYGPGNPYAADIIKPKGHCSFDYDAVGSFNVPYEARIGKLQFSEVEKHGIEHLHLSDIFMNVPFPDPPVPERPVQDLRPKAGSAVIDAGVLIPNINDKYTGKGPDIGAYELGEEYPHYGPR
jgi:hypothetical protein